MPNPAMYDPTQGGYNQGEAEALGNAASAAMLSAGNVDSMAIHPLLTQPDEHNYIYRIERSVWNAGGEGSGQR